MAGATFRNIYIYTHTHISRRKKSCRDVDSTRLTKSEKWRKIRMRHGHRYRDTDHLCVSIQGIQRSLDGTRSVHWRVTNDGSMSMDLCIGDDFLSQDMSSGSMESGGNPPEAVLHGTNLQLKREPKMAVPELSSEDTNDPPDNSKKRSRISGEVQKKRTKKNQKLVLTSNNDEDNNAELNKQSSSSCCLEDDSNASQDLNRVNSSSSSKGAAALDSNSKTRASKGSATDPQSLYARKRRERINERLRILQKLVPNGTKVDISTMLEEAVQYVKFLQLQIKLLSSDDLWMYAPIAYNGLNIGLDLNITTPRW